MDTDKRVTFTNTINMLTDSVQVRFSKLSIKHV